MPVFVAQLIGIADVSRGVVAGRGIARVGVAILSLDVVGPGRGMDEGEAVAIGVRSGFRPSEKSVSMRVRAPGAPTSRTLASWGIQSVP